MGRFMSHVRRMLRMKSEMTKEEARRLREERDREADNRLHHQATKLHVLEWEAYGRHHHRGTKESG